MEPLGRQRTRVLCRFTVMIEHAEMLDANGTLYTANLRKAVQKDIYILRGSVEDEEYEPRFTYHGFRYVEVEGADDLDEHSLVGCAAYSAMAPAGLIETSDARVNRLFQNIVWGQKGNFFSVPTDCPQRDERLGWTGDAQVFARTASYNMNVAAFFRRVAGTPITGYNRFQYSHNESGAGSSSRTASYEISRVQNSSAGIAADDARIDECLHADRIVILDDADQGLHCHFRDPFLLDMHGGQFRHDHHRLLDIVEADDRDIIRYANTELMQRFDHADRDIITFAEQSGWQVRTPANGVDEFLLNGNVGWSSREDVFVTQCQTSFLQRSQEASLTLVEVVDAARRLYITDPLMP